MKISIDNEEPVLLSIKRCCLPIECVEKCPICGNDVILDLYEDYLCMPILNKPFEITFYCEVCEKNGIFDGFNKLVKLGITMSCINGMDKKWKLD